MEYINLHTLTSNVQAISFYKSFGFKVDKILHNYYNIKGENKDAYHMVLATSDQAVNIIDSDDNFMKFAMVIILIMFLGVLYCIL